jgi:hypothetical protein
VQEDEEEDLRAMEGASRMLNRADFETDEQFQAYKARKEAAPKAAFQFGVKVCICTCRVLVFVYRNDGLNNLGLCSSTYARYFILQISN